MSTQLEQLLAYFDRPGVSELSLCVGKPITMQTAKGVLNVTGRALGSEQLASLVRGSPLEALLADETAAPEAVQVKLGERAVVIEILRGGDGPTLRLLRADAGSPKSTRPPPRGRSKSKSSRPPGRQTGGPATKPAGSDRDELAARTRTAIPSGALVPPAFADQSTERGTPDRDRAATERAKPASIPPADRDRAATERAKPSSIPPTAERAKPSSIPPATERSRSSSVPPANDRMRRSSQLVELPPRMLGTRDDEPRHHRVSVAPPAAAPAAAPHPPPVAAAAPAVAPTDDIELPEPLGDIELPDLAPPVGDLELPDLEDAPLELAPEPAPRSSPSVSPAIDLPPPGTAANAGGPPGLEIELGPSSSDDVESSARPLTNKLHIDVSDVTKRVPTVPHDRDGSGLIAIRRPRSNPLSHETRSLEALGLPADIAVLIARERGLVLISAMQGHGKTSTLAALFDRIERAVVPHVVTIDELRDRESIDMALAAAEGGYFVLATITAPSPLAALDALLDHFPGMAHGRVRTRLAATLAAVIAKRLPPTPSEILMGGTLRTLLGD